MTSFRKSTFQAMPQSQRIELRHAPPPSSALMGMPSPNVIKSQEKMYSDMVDTQLTQGMQVLRAQLDTAVKMLHAQADHQIMDYNSKVELEVYQQNINLQQARELQVMSLKQKLDERKHELDNQAKILKLGYEKHHQEKSIGSQQKEMEVRHRRASQTFQESKEPGLNPVQALQFNHIKSNNECAIQSAMKIQGLNMKPLTFDFKLGNTEASKFSPAPATSSRLSASRIAIPGLARAY